MLEVRQLEAGYGPLVVLRDFSLTVAAGEVSVLLGRNGAGKTTLMRAIAGHRRITQGRLVIDGQDLTSGSAHQRTRAGVAYVPQGRGILGALTVHENLLVGMKAMRLQDQSARLAEVLERFPMLQDKLHAKAGGLSGGQQQVLAIGRALICDVKVLLLDEPTEGIQPSVVADIAATISATAAERGLAVLVVEQNLDFVASVAEHVKVLDRGSVVAELRVDDLMREEALQHEYLGV